MTFCGHSRRSVAPLAARASAPGSVRGRKKSEYSGQKIRRMENERHFLAFEPRSVTP